MMVDQPMANGTIKKRRLSRPEKRKLKELKLVAARTAQQAFRDWQDKERAARFR